MLYSLKYFELFYIIHTISHVQKLNTELAGSQINNLTIDLKQLEKEEMKNPRVSRRKGILKIRAKINAKETKETIAKINKAKSCFF